MKCKKAASLLHALCECIHVDRHADFGPVKVEIDMPAELVLRLFMFDFDGDCDLECCDALEVEHPEV